MFFDPRKRSKFGPWKSRADFVSQVRCVLAGAPDTGQRKKEINKALMASASRRFMFETIEPRVLLSADLAPGATVHTPTDQVVPPGGHLSSDAPAADVRIVPSPSAAYAADTTGLAAAAPDKASDVVAASFTLTIDGAGTAIGSYQFQLPAAGQPATPSAIPQPGQAAATGQTTNAPVLPLSPPSDTSSPPVAVRLDASAAAGTDANSPTTASPANSSPPASTSATTSAEKSIAFVDSALPDYQSIVDAIKSGQGANGNTDIVVLDSTKSEIQQITDSLAGRTDIAALYIFSHGFEANLDLGADRLDTGGLDAHANQLQSWGASLKPGADILLYGCDIGAGDDGTAFIDRLSALTGAKVAASTDDTGGVLLGGNWTLEKSTGAIDATPRSTTTCRSIAYATVAIDLNGEASTGTWECSGPGELAWLRHAIYRAPC
jgi:hypothetical protein